MNEHTPGPLRPIPGGLVQHHYSHILLADKHGALGYAPKHEDDPLGYTRYREPDARLLAASYSAFDKAGRELGLDAAKLAESVDIAALIRFRATVAANLAALEDSPISFMSNVRQALQDTEGAAPDLGAPRLG